MLERDALHIARRVDHPHGQAVCRDPAPQRGEAGGQADARDANRQAGQSDPQGRGTATPGGDLFGQDRTGAGQQHHRQQDQGEPEFAQVEAVLQGGEVCRHTDEEQTLQAEGAGDGQPLRGR